jgi:hypothetical protein
MMLFLLDAIATYIPYDYVKTIVTHHLLPWYPMAALTITPIAYNIPRDYIVIYLISYCIASLLVIYMTQHKKETPPINHPCNSKYNNSFFSDMKITLVTASAAAASSRNHACSGTEIATCEGRRVERPSHAFLSRGI